MMNTQEENRQVLNLVQAMIGAISPNIRRIALEVENFHRVRLVFLLEADDPIDREEIDDIVFEFEALQESGVAVELQVLVNAGPLEAVELPRRVVFGRRE